MQFYADDPVQLYHPVRNTIWGMYKSSGNTWNVYGFCLQKPMR